MTIEMSWCCNLGEHVACDTKDCACECHGLIEDDIDNEM